MEKIRINIYKGKEYTQIIANRGCMFAEVALKYFQKTGLREEDDPQFFFNGMKIRCDSCYSLDELNIKDGAKINVIISNDAKNLESMSQDILKLKNENQKLKTEINDLKKKLYEKEKIINLYEELRKKDDKIEELKEILKRYPVELSRDEKLMSLIITSSDQKINYSIICKNTDKFIKIEGMIYNEYPEYEELANYFISNGK